MNSKLLIGIFCFLICGQIQASRIDDLKRALETEGNDTLLLEHYSELFDLYKYVNIDSSAYFGKKGLALAEEKNLHSKELSILMRLGWLQAQNGNLDKSRAYYQKLETQSKSYKDTLHLAIALNGLGSCSWQSDQYELALEKFQKVYQFASYLDNKQLFKMALNNIGLINANQERYTIALEYFDKLLKFSLEEKDSAGLFITYLNIGNIHTDTKEYDKAEQELTQALNIALDSDLYNDISLAYIHLGFLYLDQKQYTKATKYADLTLKYAKKYGLKIMQADAYVLKAKIYSAMERYQDLKKWVEIGIAFSDSIGYFEPDLYNLQATAYEKTGDFKLAYLAQTKFHQLKDSLFTLDKEKEFAALQISFQSKEKDAENAQLLKEKDNQTLALKQKSILIGMISTVLLLLFLLVLQQIFARNKARKMNDFLEREVHKRTEELKRSNDQLTKSNDEIKKFAYIASHDLKEPIRNIGGFISLIQRKGDDLDRETQKEYLEFIQKSNDQLTDLVDSILKYSNIDAEKHPNKEVTNLENIIEEVKVLLWGTIKEKNVQIVYNELPIIYCYPYVIKVVIKNLIENGIKYNHNSTPIITIRSEEANNKIKIFITDNGIGIHPDFHERVFEMFYRLNSRKEYMGSGMGLAYSKKLLEKFAGDVRVSPDTTEGNGSTFIITLDTTRVVEEEEEEGIIDS